MKIKSVLLLLFRGHYECTTHGWCSTPVSKEVGSQTQAAEHQSEPKSATAMLVIFDFIPWAVHFGTPS